LALACQKKCVIRFWFWKHSVGVFHFGYLCMKQGSLFCFVMLRWDPPKPWCFMLCSLISSKSFWWVGVQWLGWRQFGATVWRKLLIIESFSQWKLNKIKTEKLYWNLGWFLVLLEGPWWVRFNWVYCTIFRAKMWKILIFEWILLLEKFKQITNIGFGRNNQLNPQCVHIVKFKKSQFWKCEK